jgi:hypothetical protein
MKQRKKSVVIVATVMLFALCLVTLAAAKKPSPPPTPPPTPTPVSSDVADLAQLPQGKPFQLIKAVLLDLLTDVGNLQKQINNLQSELSKQLQSEVVTITSTGGSANLAITPSVVVFEEGKQNVRFEIAFVPAGTPASLTVDSYLMAAMTSSTANGDLSWIGTNSTGGQVAGFATTYSSTSPVIATITNVASLVATSATTYEIMQLTGAPAGTYYVKIFN